LIRGLLSLPWRICLSFVLFDGSAVQWAAIEFVLGPRGLLWMKLNWRWVVSRGGAKSVPSDRAGGWRATVSQRAAICQDQRRNKECSALRNHRDQLC
jgi:hypothetical protein